MLHWIDRYIEELRRYRGLIADDTQDELYKTLLKAQLDRDAFLQRPPERERPSSNVEPVSSGDRMLSFMVGEYVVRRAKEIERLVERQESRGTIRDGNVRWSAQSPARARLRGMIRVPGDKSISHRAALLGALATGRSRARGFLAAEDCVSTLNCLRALGVEWRLQEDAPGSSTLEIEGVGLHGLREPSDVLDCGNSGTTMRLIAGILAGQPFTSVLTGDESLRTRPVDRVIEPLRQMGAQLFARDADRRPPLAIHGGGLHGISYRLPIASAQVKSAVLLAGLFAEGATTVEEPAPTRDHTERMLRAMDVDVRREGPGVRLAAPEALAPIDPSMCRATLAQQRSGSWRRRRIRTRTLRLSGVGSTRRAPACSMR